MIDRSGGTPVADVDLRNVTDQLETAVYVKDREGRYLYVNPVGCTLLRRPPEEVIGRYDIDFFPPGVVALLRRDDLEVMQQGKSISKEEVVTFSHLDSTRYLWSIKQPWRDGQGNIVGVIGLSLDIQVLKEREQQLTALKNHYDTILKAMPDLMFELDIDGRYLDYHSPREELLAAPPEQFLGRTMREILPPHAVDVCMAALHQANVVGFSTGTQFYLDLPNGRHWFELSIARKQTPLGEKPCFIALSRDITERKRAETALQEKESLLRAVVDNTPLQFWARDLDERCILQNIELVKNWGDILGKRPEDTPVSERDRAIWKANNQRAYAGEVVDCEVEYLVDGKTRIYQNTVAPIRVDDRIIGIVGFNQDITERKRADEQIRHLAFFDALTALPNRRLMFDRLSHALLATSRRRHQGALLLIDLDNFKQINDAMGHDAGDCLLREVAQRLLTGIRQSDTAARLGGDEFVVILEDLAEGEAGIIQAEHVALHLQEEMRKPYVLQLTGHAQSFSYHCTCSIGIAMFQHEHITGEELLRRTDMALYQAKAAGRDLIRFFDPAMQALVADRVALEADLRNALDQGQFMLYLQPQVDQREQLIGAEALLRWQHPQRGWVSPAEFIPVAEETGLIVPLGAWVIETACQLLARWKDRPNAASVIVSVNVSARQFHQPAFVESLSRVLERTQAPAHRLKLELTESLLLDHADAVIRRIAEIKRLGVGFALDDFGTGYSSLVYLKRLPLDQLKIDRSFVNDILTDPNDAIISRTIVALGQSLGLMVIAEGVETTEQKMMLGEQGCFHYQGFLFGRPIPIDAFEQRYLG